jgi:hypothetical protein
MKTAYAKSKCPASQIRAGWSVYNAIHSGPSHGPTPAIRSVVGFVDGSCKSQDMIGSDTFSLTQEFLSHMLGVRRNAVEAHAVQQAGLIRYRRGHIIVFNRDGLEGECACELGDPRGDRQINGTGYG